MKKILALVVLLALAAGSYWYYRQQQAKKVATAAPTEETAKVTKGDLRLGVASTGSVASNLDVEVKCKAGGQVAKVAFDISNAVQVGDVLVQLDPVDEQRSVSKGAVTVSISQAKVAVAQQNLKVAEQTLLTDQQKADAALQSANTHAADSRAKAERMKDLLQKKLVSQEDYDTAQTTSVQADSDAQTAKIRLAELLIAKEKLEVLRQEVKQAEAQAQADAINLDVAKDRLKDCTVLAPIDGVVSARTVQVGQIIASATSNVGGGTALMTISDLSRLYVLAAVDESDIGKVKVDQAVAITADAHPGVTFEGKVVRIATTGVSASNVVTFEVKIEVLSKRKSLLKPLMTANVEITVGTAEQALLVPSAAVVRRKREYFVEVKTGDTKTEKQVEVGIADSSTTEIKSGLAEGDVVIVHKEANSRWNAGQGAPRPPPAMGMGMGMGRPR